MSDRSSLELEPWLSGGRSESRSSSSPPPSWKAAAGVSAARAEASSSPKLSSSSSSSRPGRGLGRGAIAVGVAACFGLGRFSRRFFLGGSQERSPGGTKRDAASAAASPSRTAQRTAP